MNLVFRRGDFVDGGRCVGDSIVLSYDKDIPSAVRGESLEETHGKPGSKSAHESVRSDFENCSLDSWKIWWRINRSIEIVVGRYIKIAGTVNSHAPGGVESGGEDVWGSIRWNILRGVLVERTGSIVERATKINRCEQVAALDLSASGFGHCQKREREPDEK